MRAQNMAQNVINVRNIKMRFSSKKITYLSQTNKGQNPILAIDFFENKKFKVQRWTGKKKVLNAYVPDLPKIFPLNHRHVRDFQILWPFDFLLNSRWLTKCLNKLRHKGKKGNAERLFLATIFALTQHTRGRAALVFHEAIERIKPVLRIVLRRVGRRIYEIPVPVFSVKQYKRVIHWLFNIIKKFNGNSVATALSDEILQTVFFQRSEALKKKEAVYDSVILNRAYSHYRWV